LLLSERNQIKFNLCSIFSFFLFKTFLKSQN
jgi:hypothetical protein